jgi:hypothetical protein
MNAHPFHLHTGRRRIQNNEFLSMLTMVLSDVGAFAQSECSALARGRRAISFLARQAARTICPGGHITEANLADLI